MLTLAHSSAAQSGLLPAEPLWRRVPTRDADGVRLSDFMMVIPGLRTWSESRLMQTVDRIDGVLRAHRHAVVFADLNLRINVLWVSVRPIPGIIVHLAALIHALVPEAKLVAPQQR